MTIQLELQADEVLRRVAAALPSDLVPGIVVVGSIATAWAFRDLPGEGRARTKDIDLLLTPAIDAVAVATTVGQDLIEAGWRLHYPEDRKPGAIDTPDDELPALRLIPPSTDEFFFVELLGAPQRGQTARRKWQRFETSAGHFGLPSFRFMPVAVQQPAESSTGLRIARPAAMALGHLLEHADPDRTPTASAPGQPPRFVKDVGRAVALWYLANEQSLLAPAEWRQAWDIAVAAAPVEHSQARQMARSGLQHLDGELRHAHEISANTVLSPYGTTQTLFDDAYARFREFVYNW